MKQQATIGNDFAALRQLVLKLPFYFALLTINGNMFCTKYRLIVRRKKMPSAVV
jgi:hypothetical protein